jgi:hypothetical protein
MTSAVKSMWQRNPRYKGLQIMTIGFIGALLGAAASFIGDILREEKAASVTAQYIGALLVYVGWPALILSALVMAAGILMHWVSIFRAR